MRRPFTAFACVTLLAGAAWIEGAALPAKSAAPRSPTALGAANELTALPWTSLAAQLRQTTLGSISALSGKKLGNRYLKLTYQNVVGNVDISAPPGFTAESPSGFTAQMPLGKFWSLGLTTDVKIVGCCNPFNPSNPNLFSDTAHLGFQLSNLQITAGLQLNATDPTRPTIISGAVRAKALLTLSGLFSATIPIDLQGTITSGKIIFTQPVKKLGFQIGSDVSASLTSSLVLTILPSQTQAELPLVPPVDFSAAFQHATLGLEGKLAFTVAKTSSKTPFNIEVPVYLPSTRALNQMLVSLRAGLPQRWPAANAPNRPDAHAQASTVTAAGFAVPRDALERGITAHIPYGAVLSIDRRPGRRGTVPVTYGLDADSTIWTGHYLAAEAFRFAATHSPEALQRVRDVLGGYAHDFDVTTDAVGDTAGTLTPVASSYRGVFARSTLPDTANYTDGPLPKRGCYYIHPSGGWTVAGRTYATYAAALLHGTSRTIKPVDTPNKPIWYGLGCGGHGIDVGQTGGRDDPDHPISRDQYSGVFMGLTYAYVLVPDVRSQVQSMFDQALDYVLKNKWNVPLPPKGAIVTTFIGDFDAQLALLRMGATVDPARYGTLYKHYAAASELAWIPVWLSTLDPLSGYYKFNLGHAYLGPPLFLETDPTLRANFLRAYGILRAATATHRNAYFNLVDILTGAATASTPSASNPRLTLSEETKSDLADWITRWNSVKGANGMPTNSTPSGAATYLAALWPNDIKQFTHAMGNAVGWFVDYPLPLWARTGNGMDFVWQRSPFDSGLDSPGSTRTVKPAATGPVYNCSTTPPAAAQIQACSQDEPREGPGVDYLLPYWIGVYLKVIPAA